MVHLCVLTILSYQVWRTGVSNNNKQKHSYKSLFYRPPSSLGRVSVLFIYLINIIQYCFIDLTLHIIRLTVFVQLFHHRRTNDRIRYQFILITPCQGQLRGSPIALCGTITIRIHDRFIHTAKIDPYAPGNNVNRLPLLCNTALSWLWYLPVDLPPANGEYIPRTIGGIAKGRTIGKGPIRWSIQWNSPYGISQFVALAEQYPDLYPQIVSVQNSYSLDVRKDDKAGLGEMKYHANAGLLLALVPRPSRVRVALLVSGIRMEYSSLWRHHLISRRLVYWHPEK